jgi:uncharacterized protein (TIGR03437 family)
MIRFAPATLLLLAATASAQLVGPQAIPRTGNPPVIFLNGFETDCSTNSLAKNFGIADQVLQASGRASVFFDNCKVPNSPSIETLGTAFGAFLTQLTYADGQPVPTVDIVGYSLGGLIVRAYLSGKQDTPGVFNPPPTIPIRKAIFIATPNFGTPVANLVSGLSVQTDELASGSHFLMDLNTWNQNHDDLRGIDAIALAGSGGTGITTVPGFDDGLVPLSSGSLLFYKPGRTRILPLCHESSPGVVTLTGLCFPNANGIAKVISAGGDNARIVASFLNDTPEWQTIGAAAESNSFLQSGSGILVRARTATDTAILPSSINASSGTTSKTLNMPNAELAYTDLINAGTVNLTVNAPSTTFTYAATLPPGGYLPIIAKQGPAISGVAPAALPIFPLVVTPRMIISIYGANLAAAIAQSTTQPLRVTLSDATVTLNGLPIGLLYVSPAQINAVLPDGISGLNKLQIQNTSGTQTINLFAEPASPSVFVIANGYAAAINTANNQPVSTSNPLRAGAYMELFLTGLGSTAKQNGLDISAAQPTVTVGGLNCPVTYAGAAPGFTGLDQLNCIIPAGLGSQASAQVIVTTGARSSPVTTVPVQ